MVFQRRLSKRVLIALAGIIFIITLFLYNKCYHCCSTPPAIRNQVGIASLDDVFNTTLGFESIFVINLPTRTDRRDGMVLSATVSDIKIEFIDGVPGETVLDKALPLGGGRGNLKGGEIGCWRAHMNALQAVIQRNLSSVLILEDDADWDVRIKAQFRDFALSSLALTQPLSNSRSTYADDSAVFPSNFSFDHLPSTEPPKKSPYGDDWDFIWVGHCGMRFPSSPNNPKSRVIRTPDPTVPELQYLRTLAGEDDLGSEYPPHTRVVHHAEGGICSLGYAVSQTGARRLLHSISLKKITAPYDFLLQQFCEDSTGKKNHTCLTVQPPLFNRHRPVGWRTAESDISDQGSAYREEALTDMIRWSTRMNLDILLAGRTDFIDQYPDSS